MSNQSQSSQGGLRGGAKRRSCVTKAKRPKVRLIALPADAVLPPNAQEATPELLWDALANTGVKQSDQNRIETLHWHSRNTPQLTPEQEAHMRAKTTQQAHDRTMARQLRQAAVSAQVQQHLRKHRLTLPGERTSYLQNKGVDAQPGIFTDPQGRWTHIPMHDLNGRIWPSQIIDPSGSKHFTSGGRTEGCLHVQGGMRNLQQAQRQGGVAVLAEGYATAATVSNILHQTQTPTAVIATFNAGNLPPVATALRNSYPNLPILIAGDDDRNNAKNVGRRKALQAATAVGGQTVFPPFTCQHPQGLTNWNDLDQL